MPNNNEYQSKEYYSNVEVTAEAPISLVERAVGGFQQAVRRHIPPEILSHEQIAPAADVLRQLQPEISPSTLGTGYDVSFQSNQIRTAHGQLKRYFNYLQVAPQLLCRQPVLQLDQFCRDISASNSRATLEISGQESLEQIQVQLENIIPPLQGVSERFYDNWEGIRGRDHNQQMAAHYQQLTGQKCTGLTALIVYLHDLGGKNVISDHSHQEKANVQVAERIVQTLRLPALSQKFITQTIQTMPLPYELFSLRRRRQMTAYQRKLPQLQNYLNNFTSQRAAADFIFNLWMADAASYSLLGGNLPAVDDQFVYQLDHQGQLRGIQLSKPLAQTREAIYADLGVLKNI